MVRGAPMTSFAPATVLVFCDWEHLSPKCKAWACRCTSAEAFPRISVEQSIMLHARQCCSSFLHKRASDYCSFWVCLEQLISETFQSWWWWWWLVIGVWNNVNLQLVFSSCVSLLLNFLECLLLTLTATHQALVRDVEEMALLSFDWQV